DGRERAGYRLPEDTTHADESGGRPREPSLFPLHGRAAAEGGGVPEALIPNAVAGPAEDAGYVIERERGAMVVALPSIMAELISLVRDHGTLYDAAAARPDAQSFTGRGAAYRMTLSGEDCVVRHYRR